MKFLCTGLCGFIGSHFADLLNEKKIPFFNIDCQTYAGTNKVAPIIKIDIRHPKSLASFFSKNGRDITHIVHFAAESHVDNSIVDPSLFIETNVIGTFNLLECARHYCPNLKRFHYVSTDECYGSVIQPANERTVLNPSNPYAASKASGDLLCMSHEKTYGLPITISRSSNNYGPRQHPEKFIPKCIQRIKEGNPIPIYGDGLQVRDWIHVWDNCNAIFEIVLNGEGIYNVGGGNLKTNLEVAEELMLEMNRKVPIEHVSDRPGHDRRYEMETVRYLNWMPKIDWMEGLYTLLGKDGSQTMKKPTAAP